MYIYIYTYIILYRTFIVDIVAGLSKRPHSIIIVIKTERENLRK